MSQSGSFGVNYKKVFTASDVALPAKVGAVGSTPEGEFVLVQADDADSAADIANAELEDIAFDIDIISTQPW